MQIEEPFGILPLEALCDGSIEAVVTDMKASYDAGHFGHVNNMNEGPARAVEEELDDAAVLLLAE